MNQGQTTAPDIRPAHRSAWPVSALVALACILATAPPAANAQPASAAASAAPFQLEGTQLDGAPYSVARSRGKVVMIFYWSTACSVCLSKMPELRANALGWKGKPFELVLVSVDKSRADTLSYHLALNATGTADPKMPSLWAGDPGYSDSIGFRAVRPPLSLVLDTKGRVVSRYEGRIAPEAWNEIADLMP
jgi:cytochrome oxidase Cu insertion factor (SCO1/SenC/PrrC family)